MLNIAERNDLIKTAQSVQMKLLDHGYSTSLRIRQDDSGALQAIWIEVDRNNYQEITADEVMLILADDTVSNGMEPFLSRLAAQALSNPQVRSEPLAVEYNSRAKLVFVDIYHR